MASTTLITLLAMSGLSAPTVPERLDLREGQVFEATIERRFSIPADELELIQIDRMITTVAEVNRAEGQIRLRHRLIPVSQSLDGFEQRFPEDSGGLEQTEVRTLTGFQFRFLTNMESGDEFMRLSRLLTVPLPKDVAQGELWSISDRRFLPYIFRGRILDTSASTANLRVSYQSLDDEAKWQAHGTVSLDLKTGWPMKVQVRGEGFPIPGGEGIPAAVQIKYEVVRVRTASPSR